MATGPEFITEAEVNAFSQKLEQWRDTLSDKEKAMLETMLAKREKVEQTNDENVDVTAFSSGNIGGEYMFFPQYGGVKLEPQTLSALEVRVIAHGSGTIGGGHY